MKTDVNGAGVIVLSEIYNIIQLRTNDGEFINICMRDSGFEFTYSNNNYEAKRGKLTRTV